MDDWQQSVLLQVYKGQKADVMVLIVVDVGCSESD